MLIRLVLLPLCCILILILINSKTHAASLKSALALLSEQVSQFLVTEQYPSAFDTLDKAYQLIESSEQTIGHKPLIWLKPFNTPNILHEAKPTPQNIHYYLGYLYYYQQNYSQAKTFFIQAYNQKKLNITDKVKPLIGLSLVEMNGFADLQSSKNYLEQASELIDGHDLPQYKIKVAFLFAKLSYHQKRYSQAIRYYLSALDKINPTTPLSASIDIHQGISESYFALNDISSAEVHFKRSIILSTQYTHQPKSEMLELKRELSHQQHLMLQKNMLIDDYKGNLLKLQYLIASFSLLLVLLWLRSKNLVKTMQKQATRDELTGLQNRRALMKFAQQEWHRSIRFARPYCCIAIDIDHFKNINDTWGHATGDEVLKTIAENMNSSLRVTDNLGRIGGEEFLLICIETNIEQAIILAERIRQSAESIVHKHATDKSVTISLGVSQLQNQSSLDELMANADQALYTSKRNGRNRVTVYQDNKNDDKTS